jgi:arylsulfatase A-like enzyme
MVKVILNIFCLTICICITSCKGNKNENKKNENIKPNIVWIMAEDIAPDLECYGFPDVHTPHLNAMAKNGVRYENCYSTNPICSPNRSAMMTGVHQTVINAHHHRSNRNIPLPEPIKPITYFLRNEGYTCIIGDSMVFKTGVKTDCNFKHERVGNYDGVNEFGLFDKAREYSLDDQPFFRHIQLKVTHRGDWWGDIRAKSDSPTDPDKVTLPPFMANDSLIRFDWARYIDQIEYMDNEVGLILEDLKNKGILEHTLVIFMGDNGRCNVRGKGYLFNSGLHVPLIVHWPKGLSKTGVTEDRLVATTDITASVLKIAGVNLPEYLTGVPFIGEQNPPERSYVYSARDLWDEILDKSRSITTRRYRYIKHYMPEVPFDAHQSYLEFYRPAVHRMRMLQAKDKLNPVQAFFFKPEKPKEELYDIINDPFETVNLAKNEKYMHVLDSMRSFMNDWQSTHKDLGLTEEIDYSNMSGSDLDVLIEWIKKERPKEYKRMQQGYEIGLQRLKKEYKESKFVIHK